MTKQGQAAYDKIRAGLSGAVIPLDSSEYREVLEELLADIEGMIGCLDDEGEDVDE